MKKLPQWLLMIAALFMAFSTHAEQTTTVQSKTFGYIGLGIDKVPDSLKAHYPKGIDATQGLIVTRFADESPAADDGIKVHDILVAYDDQPIEDPEKFIEKVRQDTPKRVANFKLIRQGQILTVAVTVGEQKAAAKPEVTPVQTPQIAQPIPQPQVVPQTPQYYQPQANMPAGMATNTPPPADFNGLAIRKIGEGVYDASIAFVGLDGTPQRRSYKGSHIQILQQVHRAQDLSPAAKQQLLFALRPPKHKTQGMNNMPFGNGDMFNPNKFFKGWGW